ncbi:hypothetical protein PMALA_082840, partial [Plasmodium malariae]
FTPFGKHINPRLRRKLKRAWHKVERDYAEQMLKDGTDNEPPQESTMSIDMDYFPRNYMKVEYK